MSLNPYATPVLNGLTPDNPAGYIDVAYDYVYDVNLLASQTLPMTTKDFTTELFIRVDDCMKNVPNHSQAALWPSEVVTIGPCSSPSRASVSKPSTAG